MSALDAVESALQQARQNADEQTTLRQRYERALESKTQAISDLKKDLKDTRRAADQVCAGSRMSLGFGGCMSTLALM